MAHEVRHNTNPCLVKGQSANHSPKFCCHLPVTVMSPNAVKYSRVGGKTTQTNLADTQSLFDRTDEYRRFNQFVNLINPCSMM